MAKADKTKLLATLSAQLKSDQLSMDPADCLSYSYDNSRHQAIPNAVIFAENHEDVVNVVKACYQYQIPVTARGGGTGTTGAAIPINGGVIISFERMQQILKVDPENRVMVVEPGVTNQTIQNEAEKHGFFWPPDPSSRATCFVGGNLACNAAGPRAVKYGSCRENTLGLVAVIGTGETIKTGVYTSKGVVGYDLTRLLIGSEGTLGIITQAILKLTPLPEAKITLQGIYRDIDSATQAVTKIMAQPNTPCALEFMDVNAIDMIRAYSKFQFPETAKAMLIIEVDGAKAALSSISKIVGKAAQNPGLITLKTAATDAEVKQIWDMRKALSPALRNVAPKKINEDVVVPVAKMPELIRGVRELSAKYEIANVNFGHAGNGNIHVNLLIDPNDDRQQQAALKCLDEVFDLVIKLNGTLSGEHGVGIDKRDYISKEIDPVTLELMRKVKLQFDPGGILNPGKVLPSGQDLV